MTALRDLLDLPKQVKKTDFVVQLAEGVARPNWLLKDYAVPNSLQDSFGAALTLCRAALADGRSAATFVHGSFGSGKSHFMAVLSLILGGHEAPWGVPDLHAVLGQHEWVREKKLLRLHFHLVGAQSVEEKVLGGYLEWARAEHPEAPVPPLFEDQAIFDNAAALRATMGDEAFFAGLNAAEGLATDGAAAGWGAIAQAARWGAERFDRVVASDEPKERALLFDALAKSHLKAFATGRSGFVELDRGLGRLAEHAKGLGYQGVVLFLDEIILWLASRAANRDWLNAEAQKVAKLVESQESRRAVPIISYMARQRDLGDMVGEVLAGADAQNLRDSLSWWQGRFDTVTLEDRNLPAIVQKRVVRPKGDDARAQLDGAFEQARRALGAAQSTLLGKDGDLDAFRRVYPFSPALIEALVALSHYLQRERTALKVLMELLIEHLDDFALGRVVPIGDLFDALAGGGDPMDGAMKRIFDDARRLYQHELLPLIQREHGTDAGDRCQRLRDDHPVRLGCANCPMTACRADNRLVKTLLLAAMAHEVPVLKHLTAARLVQLNHGVIATPIPGREATDALARLKRLAAENGKLRVGDDADPRVQIVITGVDLAPILDAARAADTPGQRRARLKELLLAACGLPPDAAQQGDAELQIPWRGTLRKARLRFGNVREMATERLRCPADRDALLVVDYPFDDEGFGPADDEARLADFLEGEPPTPTLVWLPSFLGSRLQRDLGELVVIEAVLRDHRTRLQHLRLEDQQRARAELESMAAQKRQRLTAALSGAYGHSSAQADELDPDRRVDTHLRPLVPGVRLHTHISAHLKDALEHAVVELLDQRFPRHPKFSERVTPGRLGKTLERFCALCEAEGGRLAVVKAELRDWQPAEAFGLVVATEAAVSLRPDRPRQIEQALRAKGVVDPTVAQVREAVDPGGEMGLSKEASDFFVLCWAAATDRELLRDDRPVADPPPGKLDDDLVLRRPPLPSAEAWSQAINLAGGLFGLSVGGRGLNARNTRALADGLHKKRAEAVTAGAHQIADLLLRRSAWFEGDPPRLVTARKATELLDLLARPDAVGRLEALAAFTPQTSTKAVARHMTDAKATAEALRNDLAFNAFEALKALTAPDKVAAATALLAELRAALEGDQLQHDLASKLHTLALQAQRITQPDPDPGPGDTEVVKQDEGSDPEAFASAPAVAKTALAEAGAGATLRWSWRVERPKGRE